MSEEDAMDYPQPTKSFSRRGGQIMIGRASRSSGELPTGENGWYRNAVMSRRHAILKWGQLGITIQDRDSTHGTRIHRNGQILSAKEQPLLLRDGDEIQFGKTVTRVEGKSDATTACHNPLRVRVNITQAPELPKIQIKPEPVSPEKPGKFMSHTFSFSAGGESEDDERNVLKKALEINESAAVVKAPISSGTASTADKSDMSTSENDEEEEANQFTFSSPPLPSQMPKSDMHKKTGGKTLPVSSPRKRRYTSSPEGSENEEENEEEDEEDGEEDGHDNESEEDPFAFSRPASPEATMRAEEGTTVLEKDEESQSSTSGTQKTSENGEEESLQTADTEMIADKRDKEASKPNAEDEETTKDEDKAQMTNTAKATDKHAARTSTPDIAKMALVPATLPRGSSQQTLSGRTIHLFEPPILPSTTPSTTSRITTSIFVPDTQESSAKPVTSTSRETVSESGHSTSARSDEKTSSSNTSEGNTPPSPEHDKTEIPFVPAQVIGKRKREDEASEAGVDVASEPVKLIKKARQSFSLKSAVSHTVSLAAGAVIAVALLSVLPELDA